MYSFIPLSIQRLSEMIYVTVKATLEEFAASTTNDEVLRSTSETIFRRKHLHYGLSPQDSKNNHSNNNNDSITLNLVRMSSDVFSECLKMIFEQMTTLLRSSSLVLEFLEKEGITLHHGNILNSNIATSENTNIATTNEYHSTAAKTTALYVASELCISLISDLFVARKEGFSFIKFEEMQHLWKICLKFACDMDELTVLLAPPAKALRALLSTQAKAFIDQQHISHMTSLAACLESEKWTQCTISAERQYAIAKLCDQDEKKIFDETSQQKVFHEAIVGEQKYKVVWSCLFLMDIIFSDLDSASFFDSLSLTVAKKLTELLRLFNTRTKQMVLGAGALRSGAQLQSINTRHLALVIQCLDFTATLIPHIQSRVMKNCPACSTASETTAFIMEEFQRVQREYDKHHEMIFEKFVTVIKAVVQHSLAKQISNLDFDKRAVQFSSEVGCEKSGTAVQICPFFEGLLNNASMMHQVLSSMLPESQLQEIFFRIFTYIDQQVPILFVMAAQSATPSDSKAKVTEVLPKDAQKKKIQPRFSFPKNRDGMRRMLEEIIWTTVKLNQLGGLRPYTFTMATILGKKMGAVKKSLRVSADEPTATVINS